jgi:uncharacterized protein YydD (DUF2326 family)
LREAWLANKIQLLERAVRNVNNKIKKLTKNEEEKLMASVISKWITLCNERIQTMKGGEKKQE